MQLHPVFQFGSDLADAIAELSPILATFAGVKGHDARWDDLGPGGLARRTQRYESLARELTTLEDAHGSDPSADVRLALRVMREHVDERRQFLASEDPYYDLNHISSSFQMLPMVFDVMDTKSPSGIEAAARRLETIGEAVSSYRALLSEGLARGHVVARRQVEAAIEQGRAQAVQGSHYREVAARIADAGAVAPELRARLLAGAEHAHREIAALTAWLSDTYLPRAPMADGVGRDRYTRAARRQLGAKLDLLETHAWGFQEIARIETAMQALARTIGARWGAPNATPHDVMLRLEGDEASTAALPEPFLTLMRERQTRALAALEGHFDVPPPARRLDVKLAPPGGPIGAYYVAPSEDFARPGSVSYLPGSRKRMPIWQEITTAYHEGFPGHHLQIATQLFHAQRLTRFQRLFAEWTGYSEGWALYAEQLMLELGLFETPEEVLGMHAGQLARACRVVVDIGLHLGLTIPSDATFHPGERWSHALAVEMMHERALLTRERAESEVVRYLGWPAQAITYKVGQRAMLRLRDARKERDGAAFDLRRFHADVLGTGTVGLDTLAASILPT